MRRCSYQGIEGAGDLPCGEREEALNRSSRAKEAAASSWTIHKQNQHTEDAKAKREQCESIATRTLSQPQDEIGKCPADIADIAAKASDQAANLPVEAPVDAARAWERFSSAWPFDPVPYRRAAAQAEFQKLTDSEREAAIRCARALTKAWRASGRRGSPDARAWIRARCWEADGKRIANTRGIAATKGYRTNGRDRH